MGQHNAVSMLTLQSCICLHLLNLVAGTTYLLGPDKYNQAALFKLQPDAPPTSCRVDLSPLPIPGLEPPVTTTINDKLTLCGGSGSSMYSRFCFQYNNGEWSDFDTLSQPRYGSASLMINNGTQWWITGGKSGRFDFERTSVIYDILSDTWTDGPDLPLGLFGHCLEEIAEDTFLLFAGNYDSFQTSGSPMRWVYLLEPGATKWRELDGQINIPRYGASQTCFNHGGDVMMVGGSPDVGNTVESYNSRYEFWQIAPRSIPLKYLRYASNVVAPDGNVYILGGDYNLHGASDSILKWDGEAWTELPSALPFPMMNFPVTRVEDDTFECSR